MKNIELYLWCR